MTAATEKHEAWAAEIRAQLARYATMRKQVRFFPLFAVVTAPFGFFVAPWLALMILIGWLSLWATTLYITHMKGWQYKQELQQIRADIAQLRRHGS